MDVNNNAHQLLSSCSRRPPHPYYLLAFQDLRRLMPLSSSQSSLTSPSNRQLHVSRQRQHTPMRLSHSPQHRMMNKTNPSLTSHSNSHVATSIHPSSPGPSPLPFLFNIYQPSQPKPTIKLPLNDAPLSSSLSLPETLDPMPSTFPEQDAFVLEP